MTDKATRPDYREARIGTIDHWTSDGIRTLCGQALAGTPVSPSYTGSCNDCAALMPCDECGHAGKRHVWAPGLDHIAPDAMAFVYANATCWAENVCNDCSPELMAQVLALLPSSDELRAAAAQVQA